MPRIAGDCLRHAVIGSKNILSSLEVDTVEQNRAALRDKDVAVNTELRSRFIAGRHIANQQRAAVEIELAGLNGTFRVGIEDSAAIELNVRSGEQRRIIRRIGDIKAQIAER